MVEEEKIALNYSIDSLDITNITEKAILGQEALEFSTEYRGF